MRNQKRDVVMLCLFCFLSYVAFVLPYGYMQAFLEYVGYDVVEHNIILPGTVVVAIITQFFIGCLCDKYKTNEKSFDPRLIVFVLSALVMYQVTQHSFFLHLTFTSLVSGIFRTVLAVQDTWTLETSGTCRSSLDSIRTFSVISWVIGSPVGTLAIEYYGYPALSYMFASLAVLNALLTMLIQDAVKAEKSGRIHASGLEELLLDKKYVVVALISLFINVIATTDIYTAVDKIIALDAKEGMVGIRWSIQAFIEPPLFFTGIWLLKKFSGYKLMMFGTFMHIIRFLGYAVVQSPGMMIMVTLIQYATYPLIMITSETLADDITPIYLRSSGQTTVSAFYVGFSLLTTLVVAGVMASSLEVDLILVLIDPSGFVPLGLGILYKHLD